MTASARDVPQHAGALNKLHSRLWRLPVFVPVRHTRATLPFTAVLDITRDILWQLCTYTAPKAPREAVDPNASLRAPAQRPSCQAGCSAWTRQTGTAPAASTPTCTTSNDSVCQCAWVGHVNPLQSCTCRPVVAESVKHNALPLPACRAVAIRDAPDSMSGPHPVAKVLVPGGLWV